MAAAASNRKQADGPLAANRAWEEDREVMFRKSERRAWIVAGVGICTGLLGILAVAAQGPMRTVVPIPLVVDKVTGETTVQQPLASDTVPALEALDKHNVTRLVLARERYSWSFLQSDYDLVRALAAPGVFADYARQFEGPKPLHEELGDHQEWRVRIVNVRLVPGTKPGAAGDAVVTYQKEGRATGRDPEAPTTHVATVRYEYRPRLQLKERDRIDNPFGFVATAYRSDPEFNTAPAKQQ
jgi:type IV secretion system protein VirB8